MKTNYFIIVLLATLLVGIADARRHYNQGAIEAAPRDYIESQDNTTNAVVGTSRSPLVYASDSALMCLFKDVKSNNNSFCWKYKSPMVTVGWQWKQAPGANYWQMEFIPYFKTNFYFQSDLSLKRIYENQVVVEVPEFQTDVFYSFLFKTTG